MVEDSLGILQIDNLPFNLMRTVICGFYEDQYEQYITEYLRNEVKNVQNSINHITPSYKQRIELQRYGKLENVFIVSGVTD